MESFEELIDLQIANQEKAYKKAWYYKINGVLVKKLKPCHENDKVHIHRWEGCYNVHKVSINGFTIRKNGKFIELPWVEFRCKSGEGYIAVDNRIPAIVEEVKPKQKWIWFGPLSENVLKGG